MRIININDITITLTETSEGTIGTATNLPEPLATIVITHACLNIDVETRAYKKGIENALKYLQQYQG